MSVKDGGPAFPGKSPQPYNNGVPPQINDGMSLRDWFAGMALQGLASVWLDMTPEEKGNPKWETAPQKFAGAAFEIADAMLKERG